MTDAVKRWWESLDDDAREALSALDDPRRDDVALAWDEERGAFEALPIEVVGRFVDPEDARDDALARQQLAAGDMPLLRGRRAAFQDARRLGTHHSELRLHRVAVRAKLRGARRDRRNVAAHARGIRSAAGAHRVVAKSVPPVRSGAPFGAPSVWAEHLRAAAAATRRRIGIARPACRCGCGGSIPNHRA